jgi:glycosyltransferase involved in cell wall biosynthesis
MIRPLISVLTATRNAAAKLPTTIESVLAQDRSLFDYRIIDGASSDGTVSLARSYGIEVVSEGDRGVYDAYNKGIARSGGRYVYFIGAGDKLRPGVFARLAAILESRPPNTLVYGDVLWLKRRYAGKLGRAGLSCRSICHQAEFLSRSLFDLLGPYDERYRIAADWVFTIRCFADPRVHVEYVDEVIADYEGGGISDNEIDHQFNADRRAILRREFGAMFAALSSAHRAGRQMMYYARRVAGLLRK